MIIVNASEHMDNLRVGSFPSSMERRVCDTYAAAVAAFFRRSGLHVSHLGPSTPIEALRVLLGAHTLIATTPSSFSFFAGLTKAKRYITTEWYREEQAKPSKGASQDPLPPCGVRPPKFAQRFVAHQYIGRSQSDGSPCPTRLDTRAQFLRNLSEWVPWVVYREPHPILHGQAGSRAEYIALIDSMSQRLGSGSH